MKKLIMILAMIIMVAYLFVQLESYRDVVARDTETYLNCRISYYNNSWYSTHKAKDDYSNKMCQEDWSWWNYEIWYHKWITGRNMSHL